MKDSDRKETYNTRYEINTVAKQMRGEERRERPLSKSGGDDAHDSQI
jgi:hypothetical protein